MSPCPKHATGLFSAFPWVSGFAGHPALGPQGFGGQQAGLCWGAEGVSAWQGPLWVHWVPGGELLL